MGITVDVAYKSLNKYTEILCGDKVELLTQMEQFIKEQDPTYNCIIKLEQSYTAAAHK